MKIEKGVMIIKDGKAWGEEYSDGHSTSYGWIDLESAPIYDPRYCTKPQDATYSSSGYVEELKSGNIILVERRTEVIILDIWTYR